MKKYIVLVFLALLTMTGAVLEGVFQTLPQAVVQASGLLTIIAAMILVIWTLKIQVDNFKNKH